MALPPDLESKLAVFCARTRLIDFFQPHDKSGLKRIAPETAMRAIDSAGLHLVPAEHAALRDAFVDEHGLFNYGQFCDEFNDTRPAGFFERHPDGAAADAAGSRASSFSVSPLDGGSAGFFVPLTGEERGLLEDILGRVRHEVATRGIVVKQFLKDYDDHKKGLVTVPRFKREVSTCLPAVRPAELELLTKAYLTADRGSVRYMVFHNDVTPAEDAANVGSRGVMGTSPAPVAGGEGFNLKLAVTARGAAPPPVATTAHAAAAGALTGGGSTRMTPSAARLLEHDSVPANDVAAIEAAVVRQVYERRIQLRNCFVDWDPKRLGEITRDQFRRGMKAGRLVGVSPACVETLADKYAVASDPAAQLIDWASFVHEVERAFNECGLERDPTKTNSSAAHAVVAAPHPRRVRPELPPAAAEALRRALDAIKAAVLRWRIFSLAPLSDYDKCGEGMVTETQFLRVLAMFNLVPARADERQAVLDYYRGRGSKAHMIDYRVFLEEVFPVAAPIP